MLNLDEKWSNLLSSVHIVLIEWFALFSRVVAKKMRKSLVLMERKALGMSFK